MKAETKSRTKLVRASQVCDKSEHGMVVVVRKAHRMPEPQGLKLAVAVAQSPIDQRRQFQNAKGGPRSGGLHTTRKLAMLVKSTPAP